MEALRLTDTELYTLKEVLEKDIAELRVEIRRTDSHDYRKILKRKEDTLKKIYDSLNKTTIM